MRIFFTSKWVPLIALGLFIAGAFFIKNLSSWTIFEYYKTIFHPEKFNVSTTGQIGDTIGGTTVPYIAGILLDIRLIDHLILTEAAYYSFNDEGEL